MTINRIIHISVAIIMWSTGSFSQIMDYDQYTTEDGLPSMETYNIMQDSTGLIWVGTENGLVSFDGENFTTYASAEFKDKEVVEAVMDEEGGIFFYNLNKEICHFKNGSFRKIEFDRYAYENVRLFKFRGAIMALLHTKSETGDRIREIYEIKEGAKDEFKFVPAEGDIFIYGEEEAFTRISINEFISIRDNSIKMIAHPNQYFYSKDQKYLPIAPFVHHQIYKVDDYIFDRINIDKFSRFVPHGEENAFVVNRKGVEYFDVDNQVKYSLLLHLSINTVFVDAEKNVWLSTANNGLIRIPQFFNVLKSFGNRIGINEGISDIFICDDGTMLFGTISSEVIILKNKMPEKHRLSEENKPIYFTDDNDIIHAYEYIHLATINKKSFQFKKQHRQLGKINKCIFRDSMVYLGQNNGITIKNKDEYLTSDKFLRRFSFETPRVLDMYLDDSGKRLYVGTTNGLYIIRNSKREQPENETLRTEVITSINRSLDDGFWIGTQDNGVVKYQNGKILKSYKTEQGLISNRVNHVEQFQNQLLVSTVRGLSIIDLETDEIKTINESNFLSSNEVLISKFHQGKYWIGTRNDLSIIDEKDVEADEVSKPFTSLKDFTVNGVVSPYEKGMRLGYDENNIQINLQNISFKSGKDKFIKYRLPLQDSTWIQTSDPSIRLPSLKPGKYMFEAAGVNSIGLMSDPVYVEFVIDIPWWKKPWVLILALFFLAAIGFLIFKYRLKQEEEKRDYLVQINKIKDQALQLQMNPHFIFNSLNAIQGFIGTDEEAQAMNYLARFARLIRLIFEHSKGTTISLEEELEFLQLYLDLEKLRFKNKVNIQLIVDEELDLRRDIIKVPPLLIQPIVENSFKHGLFHKKGSGNLKIEYSLKDANTLNVVVEDDGIGRKKASQIERQKSNQKSSSGIKTTQERIEILNFDSREKRNEINIEDLYDENHKALGTKTILRIAI